MDFLGGKEKEIAGTFSFSETLGLFFEDKSSVTHKVVYKIEGRVNIRKRE